MVGGEWILTVENGNSIYDRWQWGPGRRSVRVMTDGEGADGRPWRGLGVVYWHPALKQVRSLALSPFDAGVAESVVKWNGETVESETEMFQGKGLRSLKSLWTFHGPDKLHDQLLEKTALEASPRGREEYALLAEWDRVRTELPRMQRPRDVEWAVVPQTLKPLERFLGAAWVSQGAVGGESGTGVASSVEWIPLANGVYVRTNLLGKDGKDQHVLDAYIYHHTGAKVLRCLVLSRSGAMYEGNVTVMEDGGVSLHLKGYEGERVSRLEARIALEQDDRVWWRVWLVAEGADGGGAARGDERTLLFDARSQRGKWKTEE